MAGITLETAQAQLDLWIAADQAVASGQSYSIGGRSLTRANAAEITNKIDYWNGWVNKLSRSSSGIRVRYGVANP
jgi:uncharacterized protein DUF6148